MAALQSIAAPSTREDRVATLRLMADGHGASTSVESGEAKQSLKGSDFPPVRIRDLSGHERVSTASQTLPISSQQSLDTAVFPTVPDADLPKESEEGPSFRRSLPEAQASGLNYADALSIHSYVSAKSHLNSVLTGTASSLKSSSPGQHSQFGATWREALIKTMNSGFGSGSPEGKGVREGRERGVALPKIKGIGRTGKGPAEIPASMLRALGVVSEDPGEDEENASPEYGKRTPGELWNELNELQKAAMTSIKEDSVWKGRRPRVGDL